TMSATADVVIIGGGIGGTSISYHPAELGCANVLGIEREGKQGLGSTSKSLGGVGAQFATPIHIQMATYSISLLSALHEDSGQTADYRAHGYLFCATTEAHLRYLRKNQEKQKAFGLKNAEMVSREDVVRMVPQMIADDIIGGAYCPTDGFVDPYGVMTGFAKR